MKNLGNSGCEIEFHGGYVSKRTYGAGANRLRKQAEKQRAFSARHLTAPAVVHAYRDKNFYSFTMERVRDAHMPFDLPSWDQVLGKLVHFVYDNLSLSVPLDPGPVFAEKLDETIDRIAMNHHVTDLDFDRFRQAAERVAPALASPGLLPMGYCHGDLTFCNVLATSTGRTYLIDFLDTPFDTPLLDVVKLRQDTAHGWVKQFTDVDDRTLEMADKIITRTFYENDAYCRMYTPLAVLNILRVVPYAQSTRTVDWALQELDRCTL